MLISWLEKNAWRRIHYGTGAGGVARGTEFKSGFAFGVKKARQLVWGTTGVKLVGEGGARFGGLGDKTPPSQ